MRSMRRRLFRNLGLGWPEVYPPALLARCQQDLRDQFPVDEKYMALASA